jgi:hypothetical protein
MEFELKAKGDETVRDRVVEELSYFVEIQPWTEKELELQAWILRMALESQD